MAAIWHLREFISPLIRRLCPTAEFPLLFTPSRLSTSLFSSPPFSLSFLSRLGMSRVQNQSDRTSYFGNAATCHYSWIHISETQDVQWEEDREDPGGAKFKAISCSDWDHNRDVWTAFQGNYVCPCVHVHCTVCQSCSMRIKVWNWEKTGHGLCNLDLFRNPFGFLIQLFDDGCVFESQLTGDSSASLVDFYTAMSSLNPLAGTQASQRFL